MVYRSNQVFCSRFGIAFLLSWVWRRRFTEVFKLFALTSVLHSCFLGLEGAGLSKYSSFLLSLRYCTLAFLSLKAPVYRSIRDFFSHFGIAFLLSRVWVWWFTEVIELFALTSVLHSCFLGLEGDSLPKYSSFLLSLRYCFLAFLSLKAPVYRSNQVFCSHFGIAFLLSWVWRRRFTEVFEILTSTSVLHSCFLESEGAGYRSNQAFCSRFGIAFLLSWAWRRRFTEVIKFFALTSVLLSCFLESEGAGLPK